MNTSPPRGEAQAELSPAANQSDFDQNSNHKLHLFRDSNGTGRGLILDLKHNETVEDGLERIALLRAFVGEERD